MEQWIKDFFKGFTSGVKAVFSLALTIAIAGIVLGGAWWLLLIIVKAVLAMLVVL